MNGGGWGKCFTTDAHPTLFLWSVWAAPSSAGRGPHKACRCYSTSDPATLPQTSWGCRLFAVAWTCVGIRSISVRMYSISGMVCPWWKRDIANRTNHEQNCNPLSLAGRAPFFLFCRTLWDEDRPLLHYRIGCETLSPMNDDAPAPYYAAFIDEAGDPGLNTVRPIDAVNSRQLSAPSP